MFHVKHSLAERSTVSRETMLRLREYERLLLKWNPTINLISRGNEAAVWGRHFEDCLQLAPLLPADAARGVDLGSGAGFPGLVLAIATGCHIDLIEADHRKAAFLREAIQATNAPATVHAARIEDTDINPADFLTARALAPLRDLLVLGFPFLKSGGMALFQKGARAEEEITVAKTDWQMTLQRHPSATNPSGVILQLTGISRAFN